MAIKKTIYFGKTRRKVNELLLEMSSDRKLGEHDYEIDALIRGFPEQFNRSWTRCVEVEEREKNEKNPSYPSLQKTIEADSEFDAIVSAMAFFRQFLRKYLMENPRTKFYDFMAGNLEILEIDDIFWTHDCVPD